MSRSERLAAWRQTVRAQHRQGWLPTYQAQGGKCMVTMTAGRGMTSAWHEGDVSPGTYLCTSCRKVIMRGEGRWWE